MSALSLSFVIGGTSAEANLAAVKKHLLNIMTTFHRRKYGWSSVQRFRMGKKVQEICQESAIGAQFGGKYLTHDVRVIRLPRHAACPVGMGVSCSADRNIKGKITKDGIFLEQLETNPAQYLPETAPHLEPAVEIDLNKPMPEILAELSKYPIKTRFKTERNTDCCKRYCSRKKSKELLDAGKPMPEYFKITRFITLSPKTPEGMPSGSFGTTAGRMDVYVTNSRKMEEA